MLNITLKQLEVFVAVADCNSFTLAAENLYMTQSTVSVHIASLENTLGTPVFERVNKKRISLTPVGRTIYGYAKEVIRNCSDIELLASQKEPEKLRIGASTVPAQCWLPSVMSEFIGECGNCAFVLRKGDSIQVHEMIRRRTVRVGFVGTMLDKVNMDYIPVMQDRIVIIAPNNRHFSELKARGAFADELLDEPMILREQESGTRKEFFEYLLKCGIPGENINQVAEIDQSGAIIESVSQEVGISPISENIVSQAVNDGKIIPFVFRTDLIRNIYMVTEKEFNASIPEKNFVKFVMKKLAVTKHL